MTRLGGAMLKILTPAAARRRRRAGRARARADGEAAVAPRISQGLNGYDRINPASDTLGHPQAARGSFEVVEQDRGGAGADETQALDAGLPDSARSLTIAGMEAHEFAMSLRYAHIPGANVKLRTSPKPSWNKSFLVLFFKKRPAFLLPSDQS